MITSTAVNLQPKFKWLSYSVVSNRVESPFSSISSISTRFYLQNSVLNNIYSSILFVGTTLIFEIFSSEQWFFLNLFLTNNNYVPLINCTSGLYNKSSYVGDTVLPLTIFMVPFVLSFLPHLTFFLMSFNSGSLIVYYKWCQVIRINTVVLKTIVNGGCYLKQVLKLKKLKLVLETIFE